ncbi:MAG: amidohydrolase family protein [Myxococcota bacterium]
MRGGLRVVDTDCHQMEPPSMWQEHIEPAFRDAAPTLRAEGAIRIMTVEGESLVSEQKYPFSTPDFLAALSRGMKRFERARQQGYSAAARLEDMDEQGVDVQILYPTVGGQLLGREFRDPELLAACCRAYNDWSQEYCQADPERLRWAAMLPLQAPELAVAEARRAAEQGCVSYYIRPNPVCGRNLHHPDYEPLWAELERLDRPACLHDSGSPHLPSYGDRMETHTSGHILAHPFEAMSAMVCLIWFGVVERHPGLRIVHVEADAGWLPYWLQRMEQHYAFSGNAEHPQLLQSPTAYFLRSFFVAARGDEDTLPALVERVGDENVLFNTDYPHPDGTWPWGMEALERQPISRESRRRIFFDNAARAFDLELPEGEDPPRRGSESRA